jgi:hypothetical protein
MLLGVQDKEWESVCFLLTDERYGEGNGEGDVKIATPTLSTACYTNNPNVPFRRKSYQMVTHMNPTENRPSLHGRSSLQESESLRFLRLKPGSPCGEANLSARAWWYKTVQLTGDDPLRSTGCRLCPEHACHGPRSERL